MVLGLFVVRRVEEEKYICNMCTRIVCMASKNISIRKDIYEKLRAEKKPDESFSDVINRLLRSGEPSLTEFSSTISEETAEKMEEGLEKLSEIEKSEIMKLSEEEL